MKSFSNMIRTVLSGGLFVILPVLLFGLMLGELFDLAIAVATPIADALPGEFFRNPKFPFILAVVLIIAVCFITGLLLLAKPAKEFGKWMENRLLLPIPLYRAIKSLVQGFLGSEQANRFTPVWLLSENGIREIAYEIEDLGDGLVAILVPWSPTPMAGSVKVVPRENLLPLSASLGDVTRVLSQWGIGTTNLIRDKAHRPLAD